MPYRDRAAYTGSYARRAKLVRDAAYADPSTTCWRCGLTLEQERKRLPGRKVVWDAGHLVDADPSSPLAAEHSSCNRAAGAYNSRLQQDMNPSRRWF